jgi:hypothetical protein
MSEKKRTFCVVAIISQFAADSQLGVDPLLRTKPACRETEREREREKKRLAIHTA